jgi:hypothetical protein
MFFFFHDNSLDFGKTHHLVLGFCLLGAFWLLIQFSTKGLFRLPISFWCNSRLYVSEDLSILSRSSKLFHIIIHSSLTVFFYICKSFVSIKTKRNFVFS